MKYVRIFLLCLQDATAYRSVSFLWFVLSVFNTLSILLLWNAAFFSGGVKDISLTITSVQTYYVFLLLASASFLSYIEEEVANRDIQEGNLVNYLLKPFPYLHMKFLHELSWRLQQGVWTLLVIGIAFVFFHIHGAVLSPLQAVLAVVVCMLALCISFLLKIVMGMSAFWLTDSRVIFEAGEFVFAVFAGSLMPLDFFPPLIRQISLMMPFAYVLYVPIKALQGALPPQELLKMIGIQCLWVLLFSGMYMVIWKRGVKGFTGVSI